HEAIVAATINAAHALGRGGRVGALVAGRRADILVLDTDDERELAYRMGAPLIAEVYAAGRRVASRGLNSAPWLTPASTDCARYLSLRAAPTRSLPSSPRALTKSTSPPAAC